MPIKKEVEELSQKSVEARTWNEKFAVLQSLINSGSLEDADIVDTVFHLLVGGDFDLETNFVIKDNENEKDERKIHKMLDVMKLCNVQCQAEIWSKFKGICRKSFSNLQACVDVHLVEKLLNILADCDEIISELAIDMLSIVTSYNIRVKELKQMLSMLKSEGGKWPRKAVKLLHVLKSSPEKHGPDCFFNFSGLPNAAIALPPLKTWPYANGFTFTTWFRMDPLNNLRVDIDKPYLYCFRNSKGLGYSGHFVGGCFIITILKSKSKGFQHCMKFDFKPKQWYMVTVVHVYNRWRTSELKCYANGQLASGCEMNWCIGGNDQFDKCFLGSAESGDNSRVFCGQMAATYVFSETLTASQIYAIYQLGPGYKNQFKFASESDHLLANHHRKVLYEDHKLSESLVFAYNAKSTDGQLCLECSPRSPSNDMIGLGTNDVPRWFVHSPHALMLPGVEAIVTHSIHSALHSVGGVEILFPLFAQLDYRQMDGKLDVTVCSTLLQFLFQLLQGSVKTQQQILHGKGFLVIGSILEKSNKAHVTETALQSLIEIGKLLEQAPNGVVLMRQFCDHILFNPALWIHTSPKVQNKLYTFLATELVQSAAIQSSIRRVSTVLLFIHALKYYYWVVDPQPRSGIVPKSFDGARPSRDEIMSLRAFILLFIKQLITRSSQISEDELQSICGYLLTIHEDDNLLDVVQLLVAMISEHGSSVSPVFDARNGLAVIFKLLASKSLLLRIQALKLLAYFLKNLTVKRKNELMDDQSLFSLIGDRLLLHDNILNISTYNALYEVMIEKPCTQVLHKPHSDPGLSTTIHNPALMKVIANVLRVCSCSNRPTDDQHDDELDDVTSTRSHDDVMEIKMLFLNDLLKLFQSSSENRRILLQQSVWQDWLLDLGYLQPKNEEEVKCQEIIYNLFQKLLYHAIKLEWGGWRVWVDTLAIIHAKISLEHHEEYLVEMYSKYKQTKTNDSLPTTNGTPSEQQLNNSSSEDRLAPVTTDDVIVRNGEAPQNGDQEGGGDSSKESGVTQESQGDSNGGGSGDHVSEGEPNQATEDDAQVVKEDESPVESQEDHSGDHMSQEDNNEKQTATMTEEQVVPSAQADENGVVAEESPHEEEEEETSHDTQEAETCQEARNDVIEGAESSDKPQEEDDKPPAPEKQQNEQVDTSAATVEPTQNDDVTPTAADENVTVTSSASNNGQSSDVTREEQASTTSSPNKEEEEMTAEEEVRGQQFSPGPRTTPFRVPEFKWNGIHLRVLDDLFKCIEEDISSWKTNPGNGENMMDIVGSSDNIVYVHNTVHLVSQMMDNIILACGGILPILSSATSPNYELDSIESSQGLTMKDAWDIMNRLMCFVEVMAFAPSISLSEIENEKNISSGGVLRQCLRSACLCAVRNCLENRYVAKEVEPLSTTTSYMAATNPPSIQQSSYHKAAVDKKQQMENGGGKDDMLLLASDAAQFLVSFMSKQSTPITDRELLLQHIDIHRLRSIIYYREIKLRVLEEKGEELVDKNRVKQKEDAKQAQFLGVAVVYFISVLMVSKYRDILDPFSYEKLKNSTVTCRNKNNLEANSSSSLGASPKMKSLLATVEVGKETGVDESAEETTTIQCDDVAIEIVEKQEEVEEPPPTTNVKDILKNLTKSSKELETVQAAYYQVDSRNHALQVKSIQSNFHSFDRSVIVPSSNKPSSTPGGVMDSSDQQRRHSVTMTSSSTASDHQHQTRLPPQINTDSIVTSNCADVSSELERSMKHLSPLIRDIFVDFSSYLSKTLVGSHGQDLLVEGLSCMKSHSSIVEIVMLLCSQEWQNSIQKNAGLAFIELINEGRILCHAMKEHLVRVANEADFILSKQKADDVKLHAQFQSTNAIQTSQQRDEEKQCDALISAAKHRDQSQARSLTNRITNILTNKLGAWGSDFDSDAKEYWRLDSWEDDTRRRRRFVRNPYGSSHQSSTLHPTSTTSSALTSSSAATDAATDSTKRKLQQPLDVATALSDDDVTSSSDQEIDQEELQGNVSLTTEADLICPGLCLHGNFSITTDEIFFEVNDKHESYIKADTKVLQYADGVHGKWLFQEVRAVYSRKYLLQNTAMEIFFANRTSVMFNFGDFEITKKIISCLPRVGIGTGYGLPQDRRTSLASPRQLFKQSNMTERWQKREISNFEYLMFLNSIAGRTMNDLNQYPVFPWVISNYEAETLDLSLASNFRNFAQPIGALNPKRAEYFKQRFESWEDGEIPKFHYGTHYSNSAFTLSWLIRVEPFTSLFLSLQGGKFDHADRTFHSIQQSWKNCQRDSHDVKELIPEFFYLPEMFVNDNRYNLGRTSEGHVVDDVILPPWAKSADDFVRINRMALESEIVSCQLHQWIDLIFGFKQRGPAAVSALNVFYYLTYENSVSLSSITDPIERAGVRDQIKNFGQTPSQLLIDPHSPKSSAMHLTPMMFTYATVKDLLMVLKFESNSPIVHVTANTHPSLHTPAVVTCTKNLQFAINTWIHESDGTAKRDGDNSGKKHVLPMIETDAMLNQNKSRRQITDMLDQSVRVHTACFSVTADNRFLVSCGYWDRSFRVVCLDTAKLQQTVFGHWDVVTCITRSETYIAGDCYFVTGSRDTTLMLWYWSGRRNRIIGDSFNPDENPSARAVLTGHNTEITCCSVCAELGLIASGSLEGPVLLHTITGDLLRSLDPKPTADIKMELLPKLMLFTGEGMIIICYGDGIICSFTMNGRQIAMRIIEDDVIQAMLSSNTSQYLVTGGKKGFVQIWNAWDFAHLYTYQQCDASIYSITISHDQKNIICGMSTGSIVVFRSDFNKWNYEYNNPLLTTNN